MYKELAISFLSSPFNLKKKMLEDFICVHKDRHINNKIQSKNDDYILRSIDWVINAEKEFNCGGIPARYYTRKKTYQFPYPETTGYWIPTLIALYRHYKDKKLLELSLKSSRWLMSRQLDNGAIRCNVENPAIIGEDEIIIFDCGAILQGLVSILIETGDDEYVDSIKRLADFLCATQEESGEWKKHLYFNYFGSHNSLVGYSLIFAGVTVDNKRYLDAGIKCLNFIKKNINTNGYIEACWFNDVDRSKAFLHPYVYTIEGFLKSHQLLPNYGFLDYVMPSINGLVNLLSKDYLFTSSYLRPDMKPLLGSAALTANAQIADVCYKTYKITNNEPYLDAAKKMMCFLRDRVNINDINNPTLSVLPATYPIYTGYGPFTVNNWGIKYFVDASLEEIVI